MNIILLAFFYYLMAFLVDSPFLYLATLL